MGWYDDMGYYHDVDGDEDGFAFFDVSKARDAVSRPSPRNTYRSSPMTHNLIVKIKKETPKAFLVVAHRPGNRNQLREFWIPKSQVSARRESVKRRGLEILTISDWIYSKLEPCSATIYEDYDYVTKPRVEPGKKAYKLDSNKMYKPK